MYIFFFFWTKSVLPGLTKVRCHLIQTDRYHKTWKGPITLSKLHLATYQHALLRFSLFRDLHNSRRHSKSCVTKFPPSTACHGHVSSLKAHPCEKNRGETWDRISSMSPLSTSRLNPTKLVFWFTRTCTAPMIQLILGDTVLQVRSWKDQVHQQRMVHVG